jgi:oxygen-dependent protoporphyrinogen oxidase
VLSIQATFPQLAEAERMHGSVLRGAARALPTGDRRGFVTLPLGLGELVSALTTELGDVVRARSRVTALTSSGDGYRLTLADGTTLTAESVVLAVDASAASAMVAGIDAHLAGLLRRFAAVPVATVSLGFRTPSFGRALRGSGVLWPSVEGGALVAASWSSNKFAGRAPDAAVLVRGFFGRAGHEAAADQPDDILIADLRDVLRRLTGSSADPVLARVHRPVGGMPQYTMGHAARVGAVRDRLAALPGVAVAGASFDGVGIPACIASAWAAVDQVLSAARVPT